MRKQISVKKPDVPTNKIGSLVMMILITNIVGSCSKESKMSELKPKENIEQKKQIPSHSEPKKEWSRPVLTAEQMVSSFVSELKQNHFSQAYSWFDDVVKKRFSEEKLSAFWKNELVSLGKLSSFINSYQSSQQGKNIHLVMLKFEKGESWARFDVDPKIQKIVGIFFGKAFLYNTTSASYVDARTFRQEEISFGEEPFTLKGTLTIPNGSGPFPAVVLVHGSGPNDRDETGGNNKPFKDIAEGLSSRGIAVLRYDKRTWVSIYKISKVTIDREIVDDAIEAIMFLQRKSFVNPQKMVVIGHSLGALLTPEIAVRATAKTSIAGVVLLAPPARTPWDAILQQFRYLGVPSPQVALMEKDAIPLREGKQQEGTFWGISYEYWRDWASRDGIAMVKKLAKPTLILRGDRDYQVIDEDIKLWQQGLKEVAHVEIMTLPQLNHLLIAGTGKPGPSEYEIPGHVDAAVIDKLADFMGQ